MNLESFNEKFIPSLVERLIDLWSPKSNDNFFNHIYVEAIIRQNIYTNDLQLQLTNNNELCAITFSATKNQHNSAESWWLNQFNKLPQNQQNIFLASKNYLNYMDNKTVSYMTDTDVKLSLFVSTKSGFGKTLLEQTMAYYKSKGFKNLYLWTDCDCNVNWYFDNGFELVEEEIYKPFSKKNDDYKTYVFKKKI